MSLLPPRISCFYKLTRLFPRAYIVADPKQVTADEIIEWVAGQVSNHKRLRGGVVFLPAIPKSPSGKILRKDLRALAKKQAGESKL